MVEISHILSAIYFKGDESSGSTCGCNGGILLKIHNLYWSHISTRDANMFVIGKYLKEPIFKNVSFNCRCFAENPCHFISIGQ